MRQFSNRIRKADLEIERLRLAIIDQYPVPVLMDLRPLTDEQRQMIGDFQKVAIELGSVRAATRSSRFTQSHVDALTNIHRSLKPMPGPPVPHPLGRQNPRERKISN